MSTLSADPLRPPQAPAMGRGFGLALLAHALLVLGLSLGVQWHTQTEPAFEAELWSLLPQAAAPRLQEPEPQAEAEQPKAKTPPPVPEAQPDQRDAEIAIAKEKKRKEEERRQAELELQRKKELEKQKALEKEKEREKLKEQERQKKEDLAKQEKLEKQKQEKAAKDAQAKLDALRKQNLERMMGLAGANGSPGSAGTALQSSGPSATYAGRIKAAIRPNIIYTASSGSNPQAEVEVRCAPDGKIISSRLSKPSGDGDWDRAVLRAIERTDRLPRNTDGRVPPALVISFKPND
ncbi:cell envelope integrity protein TolA [Roseateles sp. DB2]|uniref:cell envelope integrity protein TolA n=1 Tax=Roseateles sp. DB2 TaxID=3453717 RepID=UPI003EED36E0